MISEKFSWKIFLSTCSTVKMWLRMIKIFQTKTFSNKVLRFLRKKYEAFRCSSFLNMKLYANIKHSRHLRWRIVIPLSYMYFMYLKWKEDTSTILNEFITVEHHVRLNIIMVNFGRKTYLCKTFIQNLKVAFFSSICL